MLDFSKEAVVDSVELEEEDVAVDYVKPKRASTSSRKAKNYDDEWK